MTKNLGYEHPPVWDVIAIIAGIAVVLYVVLGPA